MRRLGISLKREHATSFVGPDELREKARPSTRWFLMQFEASVVSSLFVLSLRPRGGRIRLQMLCTDS